MENTPQSERIHIGLFGSINAGKSSLINALTGSDIAMVSEIPGTTTDPVIKSMEILPLGPVVLVDTPGFNDESELGEKRIKAARRELNRIDIALLVVAADRGFTPRDKELLRMIRAKSVPHIIICNKIDLRSEDTPSLSFPEDEKVLYISASTGEGIHELKEALGSLAEKEEHSLMEGLVEPGDTFILVCPIDESAPKSRLILPQQMAIRDILNYGGTALVTKETELSSAMASLKEPPKLVITDSQAFKEVNDILPKEQPLTSFSILMARYKGFLETSISGIKALDTLKDGDTVLMSEGCTHHRQCNDIGTVKIPAYIKKYTGKDLIIKTSSGKDFPEDLSPYSLIIHCGGCMITEREVKYRMKCAVDQGVPFTNYGITLAKMTGVLDRGIVLH